MQAYNCQNSRICATELLSNVVSYNGKPGFNFLDYSLWGILLKACAVKNPNLDSLKKSLVSSWNEIDMKTNRIIDDFIRLVKTLEAGIFNKQSWSM